jgi:hypothetical protein
VSRQSTAVELLQQQPHRTAAAEKPFSHQTSKPFSAPCTAAEAQQPQPLLSRVASETSYETMGKERCAEKHEQHVDPHRCADPSPLLTKRGEVHEDGEEADVECP